MSSLFNDMSSAAQSSSDLSYSRSRKRKSREASPLPPSSPPRSDDQFTGYRHNELADTSSDGPADFHLDSALNEVSSSPMKKPRTSSGGATPAVQKLVKLEMDPVQDEFDDMLENSFDNDVMMD